MSKKILYVWKGNYPWEIRIKKFCHTFVESGYEVFLLARHTGEKEERELVDGVNVIRIGKKAGAHTLPIPKNPIWHNAIENAINEIKPDILIVREIMLVEAVALLGKKHFIPVLMDMAEFYPGCMRAWKKYNSNALLRFMMHKMKVPDWIEKRSVKLCDGIIVVCEEQIERLHSQCDIPKNSIAVVHNTPILEDFNSIVPSIVNIKNKIKNNNVVKFCNHGFLTDEKPITNFLLGFESVANKYNIQFIVAGTGASMDNYKNLVSNFKNKNKIIFTGKYDYNSLAEIINSIDIGVLPFPADEQNSYTIQNKLFDYMIAGKPVLAGNSIPTARVLEETKAGLALDFENSVAAAQSIETMLLSDTEIMSKSAIVAVNERYNWKVDAKVLMDFVEKFLS